MALLMKYFKLSSALRGEYIKIKNKKILKSFI
jgi:hypothetical protein